MWVRKVLVTLAILTTFSKDHDDPFQVVNDGISVIDWFENREKVKMSS